jgi:hypothetical protein
LRKSTVVRVGVVVLVLAALGVGIAIGLSVHSSSAKPPLNKSIVTTTTTDVTSRIRIIFNIPSGSMEPTSRLSHFSAPLTVPA